MDDVVQLRAELETLRSRLRVMGWAGVIAGMVLAGMIGAVLVRSPGGPVESLTVRELLLVDEAGTVRGEWRTSGLNDARIVLADPSGRPRMSMKAGEAHVTLELTDAGQRTLVRLSAVEDLTTLHLARAGGGETAQLQVGQETASLMLANLDHSLSAHLRADVEGTDLSLARTPMGGPPRAAVLTAGPEAVERGPGLTLLTVDGRLESRMAPGEPSWIRLERAETPP